MLQTRPWLSGTGPAANRAAAEANDGTPLKVDGSAATGAHCSRSARIPSSQSVPEGNPWRWKRE